MQSVRWCIFAGLVLHASGSTNPACLPDAPATLPRYHIPQLPHSAGDVNAVFEYKGVKHLFHQGNSGWAHHVSADFVRWEQLETILQPAGFDGSLTLLPGHGPVILWDCSTTGNCRSAAESNGDDQPIVGLARPENVSDPYLTNWTKDVANPISFTAADGSPVTGYSGPSNIFADQLSSSSSRWCLVQILGSTTGYFCTEDQSLHNWTLINPDFFGSRGGGGGILYPLPANDTTGRLMLQTNFAGHSDGSAWFAVGHVNQSSGNMQSSAQQVPLDVSESFRYFEVGYRSCQTGQPCGMVTAGWVLGVGTSIVRDVTYDSTLELLLAYPVHELQALRGDVLANLTNTALPAMTPHTVVASGAASVDVELEFHIPLTAVNLSIAVLGASAADAAVQMSFSISAQQSAQYRNVTFQSGSIQYGFLLHQGEPLTVRLLVDKTLVEAFVQRGRVVASLPNYQGVVQASAGVFVTAGLTDSIGIVKAQVWDMKCGWK